MTPNISLTSDKEIIEAALSLLPGQGYKLSPQEKKLVESTDRGLTRKDTHQIKSLIRNGKDPLGDAYCAVRSPDDRRKAGAVYTPNKIVDSMLFWSHTQKPFPIRIVDPGAGSGRFILKAGQIYSKALLIGIECDPVAALILRANAAASGLLSRLQVIVNDYRSVRLSPIHGRTLFIGNPPYTRHHDIPENWKDWFAKISSYYGAPFSKLAGLHVHFFAKTLQLAKDGDLGAFITSSEWLDVNYGKVLRYMLTNGLGGLAIHVLSPENLPFKDVQTTGAITCFRVGNPQESIKFKRVNSIRHIQDLTRGGHNVSKLSLQKSSKWSIYIKRSPVPSANTLKLGDLFDVHRGQVTGCNRVFVEGNYGGLLPSSVLYPAVTKAKDLFNTGHVLTSTDGLKRVIDIPADLSVFGGEERQAINDFIAWAKAQRADESYVAQHRKPWWSVRLYRPAPILCTYMARRTPRFVRNLCDARHINIAHGLYPTVHLNDDDIGLVIDWLNRNVALDSGRTYAGGLTKFEPGEVMNIPIPRIDDLRGGLSESMA